MEGLDFSSLTDDQLVELARACCLEAVRRNPATYQAMNDMMLSEAEKIRIARTATEGAMAAARAREREQIAREAEAKVRADEERRTAASRAKQAQDLAQRAQAAAEHARHRDIALLRQAALLVGRKPGDISLLYCKAKRGTCVFINPGADRYTREHLVSFEVDNAVISTVVALVKHKPALTEFCASLMAQIPIGTFVAGGAFSWPEE